MMRVLFWIGLITEASICCWYLYKVWSVYTGRSGYIEEAYPDLYKESLPPAVILGLIVVSALIAKFWFRASKVATWIVFSPVVLFALALVGMVIASMFIKDWR